MDAAQQTELIEHILNHDPSIAPLNLLALDGLPSRDQIHKEIEERLLVPKPILPKHWLPSYQIHWQHSLDIPSLLKYEPSPPPTTLSFVRSGLDGHVTGYIEAPRPSIPTGLTSTSLDRAPGPSTSFVRGKAGHVPFWPGGMDDISKDLESFKGNLDEGHTPQLLSVPPGFSRGLRLPGDPDESDIEQLIHIREKHQADPEHTEEDIGDSYVPNPGPTTEIDSLLPTTRSNLAPHSASRRKGKAKIQKRDWAHVVDVKQPLSNFKELVPHMAHKYPFELDTFQKQAVYHLEMGDSVFVAAHTSAGKTVVAEYAIALAEKHMTRAIYTSPIKALSNQKFRDFKQTFSSSSVGILTGDVQINSEASCLIMTTEILRSMLYKGADLIRDVEFVIFDEVHYVNDSERGVVWEEVIIMLPDHVSIILLSATVPNTQEFADWVGRTKKKDIFVISTPQRPVPLEHFLYANRDIYKLIDARGAYLSHGYKDAGGALKRKQDKEREAAGLPPVQRTGGKPLPPTGRGQSGRGGGGRGTSTPRGGRGGSFTARNIHTATDKNLYVHLLGHLKKKNLLPVVVFTLSKKRCEENASTLTNADLCSSVEKSEVHVAIEKAMSRLSAADRKLPQIGRMRDLLSRGIGVHHGGLLPIVKEVVEILFARGLVKILFATETFAMGVNMPARCVVFSSMRKHDGRSFRDILPGEYTQMAGRAGRRGLDATGTVILVVNDSLPEEGALKTMMLGKPGKLSSQFRLTYNMILNLLRVEALKVEEMIKRSFSENASQRLLPEQQKGVVEGERQLSQLPRLECDSCLPEIYQVYDDFSELVGVNSQLLLKASQNPHGARLLGSGRVVILQDGHFQKGNIAVLLKPAPSPVLGSGKLDKSPSYFALALVDEATKARKKEIDSEAVPPHWPPDPTGLNPLNGVHESTVIQLSSIRFVTAKTIKVDVDSIVDRRLIAPMTEAARTLRELALEWAELKEIPEVDWSRMRTLEFQELLQTRNQLRIQSMAEKEPSKCSDFEHHYSLVHGEKVLKARIANMKLAISDQNLELIPDYEQRIEVLKELKFIDENSTIQLKGRVACEINSANELVMTELILENTLANYDPEEVVALLSSFVFQEKTDIEPVVTPRLQEGREALLSINDRVGRVQDRHKVAGEEARSTLKFGLVEVVYEWAKGMPFEQITALTDVPEGTIVRVITRLDETCREVRDAARVIGDAELFKKMEEAQVKIKRDIVFAASLYF